MHRAQGNRDLKLQDFAGTELIFMAYFQKCHLAASSLIYAHLVPLYPVPTLPILSLLLAHGSRGISRAGSSKQLLRQELSLKDFFFIFAAIEILILFCT